VGWGWVWVWKLKDDRLDGVWIGIGVLRICEDSYWFEILLAI
jgi:hypothetical protein